MRINPMPVQPSSSFRITGCPAREFACEQFSKDPYNISISAKTFHQFRFSRIVVRFNLARMSTRQLFHTNYKHSLLPFQVKFRKILSQHSEAKRYIHGQVCTCVYICANMQLIVLALLKNSWLNLNQDMQRWQCLAMI